MRCYAFYLNLLRFNLRFERSKLCNADINEFDMVEDGETDIVTMIVNFTRQSPLVSLEKDRPKREAVACTKVFPLFHAALSDACLFG